MVSFGNESKIAISSAVHDFACVNSIGLNFSLFAFLNQINSMSLQFKEEKKETQENLQLSIHAFKVNYICYLR